MQIICGIVRSLPPPVSIENREYPPSRISVEAWCSLIRILAREAPISSLGAEGKRAALDNCDLLGQACVLQLAFGRELHLHSTNMRAHICRFVMRNMIMARF